MQRAHRHDRPRAPAQAIRASDRSSYGAPSSAIGERNEAALARTLAEETGAGEDDPTPRLVANQVAGVYRTLFAESRRRLLAGQTADEVAPLLQSAARRAFDLLESGVGDYCTRRA